MYFWLALHITAHNSAASQESFCSPSSVSASFYSSSSYNIDCSSWLLFSTFNLNHFPPLTFTKSRTSISAETFAGSVVKSVELWPSPSCTHMLPVAQAAALALPSWKRRLNAVCWSAFLWTHLLWKQPRAELYSLCHPHWHPQQQGVQDQHSYHHLFSH